MYRYKQAVNVGCIDLLVPVEVAQELREDSAQCAAQPCAGDPRGRHVPNAEVRIRRIDEF